MCSLLLFVFVVDVGGGVGVLMSVFVDVVEFVVGFVGVCVR